MPLRLVRRKGAYHWYIRGRVRGIRVFESAGTDSQEAAEAIRIRRESQLLERSIFGSGATRTFIEAVDSYLEAGGEAKYIGTRDPKTGRLTGLLSQFSLTPLAAIDQDRADEAARKLYPRAGAATRRRHVYSPLCAILNHAAAKKWCAKPMIKGPKVKPTSVRWATPEWLKAVLPHCKPRLRRLIMVLVYAGPRLSEALRLDWDADMNLAERTMTFRTTKNGEMRTAHIPDPLLIELAMEPESSRHGPLFEWSDKCHVYGPLKTAIRKAGVAYLSPHQIGRHTFATWLRLYAKRDLRGVMQDGGWKSINAVVRYSHVIPGESARAVDLLPSVQIVSIDAAEAKVVSPKKLQLRRKLNAAHRTR